MRLAQFVLIHFESRGHLVPIAVMLLESGTDRLRLQYRRDWESIADPSDAEVLRHHFSQLDMEATQRPGEELLARLESILSNAIRITERRAVRFEGPVDDLVARLFIDHVEKCKGDLK